jgi:hypothetical protein
LRAGDDDEEDVKSEKMSEINEKEYETRKKRCNPREELQIQFTEEVKRDLTEKKRLLSRFVDNT